MKKILVVAAALIPIISSTPALAGNTDYMMSMNSTSMPSRQTSQSTTQQGQTSSVTIQNFAFMPSSITVSQGTTVTWTNRDSTAHTVTGNASGGPDSSQMQPGQTYSFIFSNAGTFPYHCSIHPQMTGTVTVTAGNSSPQSSQPSGSQSTTNLYGSTSSNSSNNASSTSKTPEASEYPKAQSTTTKLPGTGPAETAALFIAATAVGISAYYLYFSIRKKFASGASR